MSIGKLESFLGKHIEGFFNKKFSSSLEFPEVAKQLQREVMHKKKKCRRGATVPNAYFIDMNNEDYQVVLYADCNINFRFCSVITRRNWRSC